MHGSYDSREESKLDRNSELAWLRMCPIEKPKRFWQVKAAKQRQRGFETGLEANPGHSHDAGVRDG